MANAQQPDRRDLALKKLIAAQRQEYRYTNEELATILHCSRATFCGRMNKRTEALTLGELRKLAETLKIPPEDMMKVIY